MKVEATASGTTLTLEMDSDEAVELATMMDHFQHTEHPIAQAICGALAELDVQPDDEMGLHVFVTNRDTVTEL